MFAIFNTYLNCLSQKYIWKVQFYTNHKYNDLHDADFIVSWTRIRSFQWVQITLYDIGFYWYKVSGSRVGPSEGTVDAQMHTFFFSVNLLSNILKTAKPRAQQSWDHILYTKTDLLCKYRQIWPTIRYALSIQNMDFERTCRQLGCILFLPLDYILIK